MLAYILALVVGLGSLAIYMAAFFFPEVHRKSDFIWSGLGLFYALVLWVCAGRITGGVLLGQIASVALLGWFAWQTLILRRELLPVAQQTAIPSREKLQQQVSSLLPAGVLSQWQQRVTNLLTTTKNRMQEKTSKVTKPKVEPVVRTTYKPATLKTPTLPVAPPVTEKPTEKQPTVEVVHLKAEDVTTTRQPASSELPEPSVKSLITEEKVTPEVEIAPPAGPLGIERPQGRQFVPPPPAATAPIITEIPATALPSAFKSEAAEKTNPPELVRSHPPAPEIVESAIADAQAKSLPVSPPETTDREEK